MSTNANVKNIIGQSSKKLNINNLETEQFNETIKIACNKITENKNVNLKAKIRIALVILEALQTELAKTDECIEIYKATRDIDNRSDANGTDNIILTKNREMFSYQQLVKSIVTVLSKFFESYMLNHEEEFFSKKISEESKDEYLNNIYSHFCDGAAWTDDSNIRSNIINKVEVYFRGFSKKSIKRK